jgi:hypothetical protein
MLCSVLGPGLPKGTLNFTPEHGIPCVHVYTDAGEEEVSMRLCVGVSVSGCGGGLCICVCCLNVFVAGLRVPRFCLGQGQCVFGYCLCFWVFAGVQVCVGLCKRVCGAASVCLCLGVYMCL